MTYRYLKADVLSRLDSMQLRARTLVEGALTGLHRSPSRGASIEFSEHKEYAPGDELRHIDWRALGRVDKYYVKQFEQETNLRATIVVDASRSMAYRGLRSPTTKLEVAAYLAASLSYLFVRQGDAAGLLVFAAEPLEYLPPRARPAHLHAIMTTLERLTADHEATDLGAAIDRVAEAVPRRGLVVLISDLLDFRHEPPHLLRRLKRSRHDVIVLHLLDRDEIELPFNRPMLFEALEGGRRLLADAAGLRERYRREISSFIESWRDACLEANADYQLVLSDEPLDSVLAELIRRRG